jgi:hypothetical protein
MLDYPIQYMGVNAPREHQRVISRLVRGLGNLYFMGNIPYEILPETMIDEGKTSPTPDIILADNESDRDAAIIEITTTKGESDDFEKVANLVKRYKLQEGFTYNYKNGNWRKYSFITGEDTKNPSFCDSIGYDLNDFVK